MYLYVQSLASKRRFRNSHFEHPLLCLEGTGDDDVCGLPCWSNVVQEDSVEALFALLTCLPHPSGEVVTTTSYDDFHWHNLDDGLDFRVQLQK